MRTGAFLAIAVLFGSIWAPRPAAADTPTLEQIRAQPAIALSYDFQPLPATAGAGITVAIIGEGVSHAVAAALTSRLRAVSVRPDDSDPYLPTPLVAGDGTVGSQLASLIGALAPRAEVLSVKALDRNGGGTYVIIAAAIRNAAELGAKIIVLPIGAQGSDAGVTAAVSAALAKGSLIVSSAGNNGESSVQFPANQNGVLAVGATDASGGIAQFSSFGAKVVYVPGVGILAMDQPYGPASGTSHAAAVAGALLAVVWSQKPSLTKEQLVDAALTYARAIAGKSGGSAQLLDGAAELRGLSATGTPKR